MRRKSAKNKELENDARLLGAWCKWHREQLEEALAGVHRDVLTRMMAQLENLKFARELVDAIAAEDWSVVEPIRGSSACTRSTPQYERSCLTPIDDPLPGQPDNAFRIIKAMFDKFPAPVGRPAGVSGKSVE